MTTLAYRAGVLAGDTDEFNGSGARTGTHCRKVFKTKDGRLLGIAGNIEEAYKMLRWLMIRPGLRSFPPDVRPETSFVIEVVGIGKLRLYDTCTAWFPVREPFYAIGSGSKAALAALHMGADARHAVKIASLVDDSTGRRVQSVRL